MGKSHKEAAIIYNTFKELGFDEFTICINNRKILNGFFASLELKEKASDILRIIDKIEKIGASRVKAEIGEFVEEEKQEKIMQFLKIEGTNDEKIKALEEMNIENEIFKQGLEELKKVTKYIKIFGVPENNFKVDLTIARGLDYYTGTVYETFLDKYKDLGSVCSGGRYDNLAEYYTNRQMPGVGISIGLSRLFFLLTDNGIISAKDEAIADVLVISMNEDYEVCAKIATDLREKGLKAQLNIEEQKLGKKFKYADKINVKYVIIIGEDEVKNNVVTLKNMITGEQETLKLEDAIKKIKE